MEKQTIDENALVKSIKALEALAKGNLEAQPETDEILDPAPESLEKADPVGEGEALEKADPDSGGDEDLDDEDTEKSFADLAAESDEIQKAVEVSDFLGELVSTIEKAFSALEAKVARLGETVEKSLATSGGVTEAMAKALGEINQQMSAQAAGAEDLKKSVEALQLTPAQPRRAVTVLEKSFTDNAPEGGEPLTKAQITDALTALSADPQSGITAMDVVRYDSTQTMAPHVEQAIKAHFKRG